MNQRFCVLRDKQSISLAISLTVDKKTSCSETAIMCTVIPELNKCTNIHSWTKERGRAQTGPAGVRRAGTCESAAGPKRSRPAFGRRGLAQSGAHKAADGSNIRESEFGHNLFPKQGLVPIHSGMRTIISNSSN